MTNKIDSASFRQIMGCFATGIAVMTARDPEEGTIGLTVNSLTSVSLAPPLVLFCLDKAASLHPHFCRAEIFAINLLALEQETTSRYFANRHHQAKPKNLWDKPQQDCPILRGTLGWILCRRHAVHEGGDHTILVGEVIDLHKRTTAKEPLLYFHGRYRELAAAKVTSGART